MKIHINTRLQNILDSFIKKVQREAKQLGYQSKTDLILETLIEELRSTRISYKLASFHGESFKLKEFLRDLQEKTRSYFATMREQGSIS